MGNGSATTSSSTNSFTYNWSTMYVRERYSITYNGNGNTGGTVPGVTYKAHGLNVTLSNNTFQKTGYTASGWNTNTAGTGTNYANGATYSGNTNLTLYAKWVANTYVVNFDTANEILYPYSKSQAGTQGTYTTKIENNVLIYEYKVTTAGLYGPHAGGVDLTVGQQYKWSVDIKCSRARTINSVGHEMGGKKSINVTTSWQTFTYTFTATTNDNGYHAFVFYDYNTQWQVGDVLSYKNLSVQKVSGMKADNAIGNLTVTYDGTYASLPTPTKTGYTFAGWYLDSGLTKPVTTSTKVTTASNHTLYSKWTVNTYQVDVNTYLENTHVVNLDSIQFDVKVNGSVAATNAHDYNKYLNYGSSVEIYNIRVNSGYSYQKYVISVSGIESSGSSKTNIKFMVPAQKTTIGLYVVPNVYTITLNDDIGFLKNMSNWTRYANADTIKATYDKATDTNNFNIVTGGGWEVYGFQMAVTKNTNYTITFDYTVPTYDQHQTYEGYMFQVLNSTPSGNDNLSKDLATYYLPRTASSGKATVTFNSSSYSTVYIILNGGAMADGQNLTFTFKNFKMTGTRQIYMKYGVGWYSNSSATTSITSIPEIPTNLGYSFGGYYTDQGGSGLQIVNAAGAIIGNNNYITSNDTLYAKWTAENPAYYDEEGDYWYVEMGMFPQTLVKDTTTINALNKASNNSKTYTIAGQTLVTRSYNNDEYCLYNNNWYKVEPVRWRLQGSYSSGYGIEGGTISAVCENIVFAREYNLTAMTTGQGYRDSTLNKGEFYSSSGIGGEPYSNYITHQYRSIQSFSVTGTTSSNYDGWYHVSSVDEIKDICGANRQIVMSDLVKAVTNNSIKYWTRDLGSTLNTAKTMTTLGMVSQDRMQNLLGVQYTITVTNFACL